MLCHTQHHGRPAIESGGGSEPVTHLPSSPDHSRPGVAASPVRLLLTCSTLHIGGAERVAACLAKHVDRRRFDVSACYLRENGVIGESMLARGVDLVPVPGLRPGEPDRLTSLKLMRLVRERKIQVLHTHDVHGLMDASICRRAMPGIRHVHTFHFGNYPNRDRARQRVERLLWRSPDALVAVGHAQAEAIRSLYGIPPDRLRVIWNGVEDPTPTAESEIRAKDLAGQLPVIVSISTLIEQKGIGHLLEASRTLRDNGLAFRLVIVGHGDLRAALEQKSRDLRIDDCVEFLGWVPDAAKLVLPSCDVFVQSSLWEAMSIVVLEAMAAARPMVVTRVGENSHAIVDGESGLLVPPADTDALAMALARLLTDRAMARRLGASARQRYLDRFTIRPMIDAYESIYYDLARRATDGRGET